MEAEFPTSGKAATKTGPFARKPREWNNGCPILVAALPRCAVSQNCILRSIGKSQCARIFGHSADFKSAIRQITNLRYEPALCAKRLPVSLVFDRNELGIAALPNEKSRWVQTGKLLEI